MERIYENVCYIVSDNTLVNELKGLGQYIDGSSNITTYNTNIRELSCLKFMSVKLKSTKDGICFLDYEKENSITDMITDYKTQKDIFCKCRELFGLGETKLRTFCPKFDKYNEEFSDYLSDLLCIIERYIMKQEILQIEKILDGYARHGKCTDITKEKKKDRMINIYFDKFTQ